MRTTDLKGSVNEICNNKFHSEKRLTFREIFDFVEKQQEINKMNFTKKIDGENNERV